MVSQQRPARRHTPPIALTPQQQAIVNHDTGPALVYAVAGAGKTTAMVHRIARLVDARVFAPERILATSFNRDANGQIERALAARRGCDAVQVRTLHALGYGIVRMAQTRGYLPRLRADSLDNIHGVERQLLHAAVDGANVARVAYAPQLAALESAHFLTYMRRQKAMLHFPDPGSLGLPRRFRRVAQRAEAPPQRQWYADLYARFEQERLARGLLTFDDMLSTGWLMLARHEDILAAVQQRYDCVMVDEFQDVNRAQAELLDLITMPHRNYMAIGDDDQTIYQWRGASPFFIRSFKKRYRATVYFMTDNFRSRAVHLALANQVIRHDRHRQEKYLQLTRGFGGSTNLDVFPDEPTMATTIARALQHHYDDGIAWAEMAVLVRVYHQTSTIEAALTAAGIPFRVVGMDDADGRDGGGQQSVMITSIYRAKGLEWPVVVVPGCNDGLLPHKLASDMDEERRLLYVAMTRAQTHLYLYAVQGVRRSPLLDAAAPGTVLSAVAEIDAALATDPAAWTLPQFLAVAVNAKRLYLHEYFVRWWPVGAGERQAVAGAVLRFYATLRQVGLWRRLAIGREDVALWRTVAGQPVNESPLSDPLILNELRSLRG